MSNAETGRTQAERITMAISLCILIGIIGVVIWADIRVGNRPAVISVEANTESVREIDGMFYVPITITNTGGLTAQIVVISGELDAGDGNTEEAEVTIDFLAGGESEQAELIFGTDPAEGQLTIGPTSYVEP